MDGIPVSSGLVWGVKRSLLRYVRRLPDGAIALADGAGLTPQLTFHFPVQDAAGFDVGRRTGVVRLSGMVRFSGHLGQMAIDLRDPWLVAAPDRLELSIASAAGRRLGLVGGSITTASLLDDALQLDVAHPMLTDAGVEVLSGFYAVGTVFDELSVRVPVGY